MLGTQELLILLLIVLIIFGASRLPQLGRGLGEGIKNFKSSIRAGREEGESDTDDDSQHRKSA